MSILNKHFRFLFLLFGAGLLFSSCDQQITDFVGTSKRDRPSTQSSIPTPTGLTLQSPSSSPSSVATPTIRVAGVTSGHTIGLYYDSQCRQLVISGTASGSTIDLTPSSALADGEFNFYANANNGKDTSACTIVPLNYIVDTFQSTISMAVSKKNVTEANTTANITLNISPVKPYPITVNFDLYGTSATLNTNYAISGRTVTIPAGQSSANIPVTLMNNGSANNEMVVQVNLNNQSSAMASLGSTTSTRLHIRDASSTTSNISQLILSPYASSGVMLTDGKVKCWGDYPGDGTTASSTPVLVDGGTTFVSIAAGTDSNCGVTSTGNLKCWGSNGSGGAGDGTTNPILNPTTIGTGYASVLMDNASGCAIKTDNSIYCWGANSNGRVGDSTTAHKYSPTLIDAGTGYSYLFTTYYITCGISTLGTLKCWGSGSQGQLGDTTIGFNRTSPTIVDAGTTYSIVTNNASTTCGITTAGVLKCWGANTSGQLATGNTTSTGTPTVVDSGVTYSTVAISANATVCGITTAGVLKCWGANASGTIGDGSTTQKLAPVVIDSGTTYSKIYASVSATCGITTITGTLKCWGSSYMAGAESGSFTVPTPVNSPNAFSSMSIGLMGASIAAAITSGGADAMLWGDFINYSKYFGNALVSAPRQMDPDLRFSDISHSCRIDTSGGLWCRGYGDGTGIERKSYVRIDPSETYSKVSSYGTFSYCAITTSGVLKCWGKNSSGQVGDGTTTLRSAPIVIDSGFTHIAVAVSISNACAIRTGGQLLCWGYNTMNSVGDGTSTDRYLPVPIDVGTAYSSVSLSYHGCGIVQTTGALKCWGHNDRSQIGNGNTTSQVSPIAIDGGTAYAQIKAIDRHTCGITTTNALKCWGRSFVYEVGNNSMANQTTPVVIDSGTSYSTVSDGTYEHTCAVTIGGVTKCWGNSFKLANGTGNIQDTVPTPVVSGPVFTKLFTGLETTCGITGTGVLYCWGATTNFQEYGLGMSYSTVNQHIFNLQSY